MINESERAGFIQQYLRRNFITNLAQDGFCYFGFGFISFETFLPIFVSQFTSSRLLIGLVAATVPVGWLLPQLLIAPKVERMSRKKSFVVRMAFAEKMFYLVLAGLAYIALQIPPGLLVVLFIVICFLIGIAGGITRIGWGELIASILPVGVRGQYFGTSFFIGGLLGALGAYLGGTILEQYHFPQNYAFTFAIGFCLIIFGWNFLLWIQEPPSLESRFSTSVLEFVGDLIDLLKRDLKFVTFLIAQCIVVLGGMAFYFVAVFGKERLSISGQQIGLLATFYLIGKTCASLIFGWLGDRIGHRKILAAAIVFQIMGFIFAIRVDSVANLYVVILMIGVGRASYDVNVMPITYQYAPVQRRPTYIGLVSTLIGLVTILAPMIGGVFAEMISYESLFGISIMIMCVALFIYLIFVNDPTNTLNND